MGKLGTESEDQKSFTVFNIALRKFINKMYASRDYQHIRFIFSIVATNLNNESRYNEWTRKIDPVVVGVVCITPNLDNKEYKVM